MNLVSFNYILEIDFFKQIGKISLLSAALFLLEKARHSAKPFKPSKPFTPLANRSNRSNRSCLTCKSGEEFVVYGMSISLNKGKQVYAEALAKNEGLAKINSNFR